MSTALAVQPPPSREVAPVAPGNLEAVADTLERLKLVRTFVVEAMVRGTDFGVIPGTGNKPVLLLPGAQKTAMYFNCRASIRNERVELGGGHLEVISHCELVNRSTERVVAEGSGSCSTLETKYRYRAGGKVCPSCNTAALADSKFKEGEVYCNAKKGGCGAKFAATDHRIASQQAVGRIENPDIADSRNTVLKMANKRAQVAAALNLGALSELFTQDLEDNVYDVQVLAQAPTLPAAVDEGRAEVNATFQPDPKPEPHSWSEAEMLRDWWRWAKEKVDAANSSWDQELAAFEVLDDKRGELTDAFRLTNHVVTAAIAAYPNLRARVAKDGDPTRRSKAKSDALAAECLADWPGWVAGITEEYLRSKLDDARKALNLPAPIADDEAGLVVDYPPEPGSNG